MKNKITKAHLKLAEKQYLYMNGIYGVHGNKKLVIKQMVRIFANFPALFENDYEDQRWPGETREQVKRRCGPK